MEFSGFPKDKSFFRISHVKITIIYNYFGSGKFPFNFYSFYITRKTKKMFQHNLWVLLCVTWLSAVALCFFFFFWYAYLILQENSQRLLCCVLVYYYLLASLLLINNDFWQYFKTWHQFKVIIVHIPKCSSPKSKHCYLIVWFVLILLFFWFLIRRIILITKHIFPFIDEFWE